MRRDTMKLSQNKKKLLAVAFLFLVASLLFIGAFHTHKGGIVHCNICFVLNKVGIALLPVAVLYMFSFSLVPIMPCRSGAVFFSEAFVPSILERAPPLSS